MQGWLYAWMHACKSLPGVRRLRRPAGGGSQSEKLWAYTTPNLFGRAARTARKSKRKRCAALNLPGARSRPETRRARTCRGARFLLGSPSRKDGKHHGLKKAGETGKSRDRPGSRSSGSLVAPSHDSASQSPSPVTSCSGLRSSERHLPRELGGGPSGNARPLRIAALRAGSRCKRVCHCLRS